MKFTFSMLIAATMFVSGANASDLSDSGSVATGEEYEFRFGGSTKGGDCKTFDGPSVIEVFKKGDNGAKVAEFNGLRKLELCKRGRSYTFRSVGFSGKNQPGYRVLNIQFKFVVKDESERRVGSVRRASPTATTSCGTKRQSMSPLSATVSERQFTKADSIYLSIGGGRWENC